MDVCAAVLAIVLKRKKKESLDESSESIRLLNIKNLVLSTLCSLKKEEK